MTPQLQLRKRGNFTFRTGAESVPGVEISRIWENHRFIVGLNIDITHPLMCEFLAQQTERRNQRAQLIAERLEKAQIPGALESAQRLAQGGAVTRGHFARFHVECGKASSMADVFKSTRRAGKLDLRSATVVYNEAIIDVHHSGGKACQLILGGTILVLNG